MNISLGYGATSINVEIPDKNLSTIITPRPFFEKNSEYELMKRALEEAHSPFLLEKLEGKKIVIITSDVTRPFPSNKVLPIIIERLLQQGASLYNITVVIAIGSHRKTTELEKEYIIGKTYFGKVNCIDSNPDDVVFVGITSYNTEIELFREVVNADFRICLGNIEYHYFAGFSGGVKALIPGCASLKTIQQNHSMMINDNACVGHIVDNPVRLDLEEASHFCPINFLFNVVLNEHKQIIYAVAGDPILAHREGCVFLEKQYKFVLEHQAEIVLVSMGGSPKDINLYQTQKAIDNAYHAVKTGGIIIVVAECSEGFGNHIFKEWLFDAITPSDLVDRIKKHFVLGGHKAAAIAKTLDRAQIWLYSSMPPEDVKHIFMNPVDNLQNALSQALEMQGNGSKVIVMPFAGSTLPVVL